jgi:hypothetical protein
MSANNDHKHEWLEHDFEDIYGGDPMRGRICNLCGRVEERVTSSDTHDTAGDLWLYYWSPPPIQDTEWVV